MRPRVLVVEDDAATREMLREILHVEGCDVEMAADGEQAVGAIANRDFEALVLDIALPKMSGTDVMEFIAVTKPRMLASIVVVTGLEAREIRKLFPEICETLSKPVLPTRLMRAVRRCVLAANGTAAASGISVA